MDLVDLSMSSGEHILWHSIRVFKPAEHSLLVIRWPKRSFTNDKQFLVVLQNNKIPRYIFKIFLMYNNILLSRCMCVQVWSLAVFSYGTAAANEVHRWRFKVNPFYGTIGKLMIQHRANDALMYLSELIQLVNMRMVQMCINQIRTI